MKKVFCSVLVAVTCLVPVKIHAQQKKADLKCESLRKILLYAKNDFKDISGDSTANINDCNYYKSKVSFGIDSTTTLHSCKGDEGRLTIHFNVYEGKDEIQSDVVFRDLESSVDKCVPEFKKKITKSSSFKRRVTYSNGDVDFILFQDILIHANVSVSVAKAEKFK